MIEAAIVLPLLLLAIISLISLGLYCHEAFKEQIAVQELLLLDAIGNNNLFSVLREDSQTSIVSRGLFKGAFYRSYKQRLYVINEELVLRAGEVIGNVRDD